MSRLGFAAALASVGTLAGCSAGNGGASSGTACVSVTPCGGDVTGTWTVDSECIAVASPFAEAACQNAVHHSTVTVTGTVVYTPSPTDPTTGTQAADLQYQLSIDEIYSGACLAAIGLQGPSPEACSGLQVYWTGPYAVTCTPQAGACECRFADEGTIDQSDTYSVVGQEITLASSGPVDFCRAGDALVESSVSGLSTSRLTLRRAP